MDTEEHRLSCSGEAVPLEPKTLLLLGYLASRSGKLVRKQELLDALWPDAAVTEHVLTRSVTVLRRALEDSSREPQFIETIPRIGYRFIAPVHQAKEAAVEDASSRPSPGAVSMPKTAETGAARKFAWPRAALVVALLSVIALFAFGGLRLRHRQPEAAPEHAREKADPKAEEAYLYGRSLWYADHELAAYDYFKRSTELQPGYAPGWAAISNYYGAAMIKGNMDPADGLGPQQEAAQKAVALDPELPEAHLAMCGAIFAKTWDYRKANPECQRALQLDPRNAEVYHFYGKMLESVGNYDEALKAQRTSANLDPLSRPRTVGQSLLFARRYEEALAETRLRLQSFPHDVPLLRLISTIYRCRGDERQAAESLEQAYLASGDETSAQQLREAFQGSGYKGVVRWQLDRMLHKPGNEYVSPYDLALAYAQLGDRTQALAMLKKAFDQHSPKVLWIRSEPAFDGFASEPEYRRLLQQLPQGG